MEFPGPDGAVKEAFGFPGAGPNMPANMAVNICALVEVGTAAPEGPVVPLLAAPGKDVMASPGRRTFRKPTDPQSKQPISTMKLPNTSKLKLRCLFSGRYIESKIDFSNLELCCMAICRNSLYAVENGSRIVVFDVTSGERTHVLPFEDGGGLTLFREKIYAWNEHEVFELQDHDDGMKSLKRVGTCDERIFTLCMQRREPDDVAFVAETDSGHIVGVQCTDADSKCELLKEHGHYLTGVDEAHIYIYCLETRTIVDFKNKVIHRVFPPLEREMYCRFRMSSDGHHLYYGSWLNRDAPWTVECLETLTGNRKSIKVNSNQVYLIACSGFLPTYEPQVEK